MREIGLTLIFGLLAVCVLATGPSLPTTAQAKVNKKTVKQKTMTVVRVIADDTAMLRSPSLEGQVLRWAMSGEEFNSPTVVKGDYYMVEDPMTESWLYLHITTIEILNLPITEKLLISGTMPAPTDQDLSYWQVNPEDSTVFKNGLKKSKRFEFDERAGLDWRTSHNGKKYPASYERNHDYRPQIDGDQMVRDALKYKGTPYVLGGTTTKGIDCSGLTKVCLEKQGCKGIVHRASLQALEGTYVHVDDLRAGDLVFFRDSKDKRYLSHVGIYVGKGKFVHASQSLGGVYVTPLSNKYFQEHYAFARRL